LSLIIYADLPERMRSTSDRGRYREVGRFHQFPHLIRN